MKTSGLTTWQIDALGAFSCVAITLCAWCFLAAPALHRYRHEHDLHAQAIARHREVPKLTVQLTLARRQAAAIHEDIEKTGLALLPTSALNERLAQLESVAVACGVRVDEVHPGEAVAAPHYQSVPIKLTGSASYLTCADFLHRMHEKLPDISLKTMDLKASPASAGTDAGAFRFELIWLAQK